MTGVERNFQLRTQTSEFDPKRTSVRTTPAKQVQVAFKPYCPSPVVAVSEFLWIGPLRAAITLLLATVSWSVLAQTAQDENLRQVVSRLRSCVRTNAPSAQAAGVQNTSDAVNFLIKTCSPPLSELDPTNIGAVPPGMFRRAIGEEWSAFVEKTRTN